MTCFPAKSKNAFSFCINSDAREERPIILDPLQPEQHAFAFDLLGQLIDENQALFQAGNMKLATDVVQFISSNAIILGIMMPLAVPMLHYGAKVLALMHFYFFLFADVHRIILGQFWRAVFRLPKDPMLHPSYAMYVYCCDLLCISCPEPEEFFHRDNYAEFMRIAWLINPMKFTIVNNELLKQHAEEIAKAKEEASKYEENVEEDNEELG